MLIAPFTHIIPLNNTQCSQCHTSSRVGQRPFPEVIAGKRLFVSLGRLPCLLNWQLSRSILHIALVPCFWDLCRGFEPLQDGPCTGLGIVLSLSLPALLLVPLGRLQEPLLSLEQEPQL